MTKTRKAALTNEWLRHINEPTDDTRTSGDPDIDDLVNDLAIDFDLDINPAIFNI